MRTIKSERLKKMEAELTDLEQWLKLGLVPKKDIEKHKEEIIAVQAKISDEKERLQFLKESGEGDDFVAPKRGTTRGSYTEMPTIPDIDVGDTAGALTESGYESEETAEHDTGSSTVEEGDDKRSTDTVTEDHDSFFSERNRWRRGGIVDPDADDW
jgi:hypothetical protein